jgi:hypothetical protein
MILPPLSPLCRDYRCVSPYLALSESFLTLESFECTTAWKLCLHISLLAESTHLYSLCALLQAPVHLPATSLPAEGPYVLHQVTLAAVVTVTWEQVAH